MAISSKHHPEPDFFPIKRALLSVSDKDGLVDLAKGLVRHGIQLISTGGTRQTLSAAGLEVTDISDITGFPEIMDGRVKTLHPKVHGGLLAIRNDPEHADAMRNHAIEGIDLLVVNLYPFEEVSARQSDTDTIIENIDIGGPAMIRAAAKNHAYTAIVTDAQDYTPLLAALDQHAGQLNLAFRRQLAAKAFARTAAYEAAIANWFEATCSSDEPPIWHRLSAKRHTVMRYGENPHQNACLYVGGEARAGVATAQLIQGKALSYNNINDTDAAYELVAEFSPETCAAVAIIKHANPCGVGLGDSLQEAYQKALRCDPQSAFGGIVALNRPLDEEAATEIVKIFTEVIIAPDVAPQARAIIAQKSNLRLLVTGALPDPAAPGQSIRSVAGGLLVQARDNATIKALTLETVTKRAPNAQELADLTFAFCVAKHVKSNAIVYAKDGASVGIGAGQMSRIDSARIAATKADEAAKIAGLPQPLTKGSVVASDAFFPFADGLLAAIEAGATAVIQPGGSIRDSEVIAAADAHDIAMVFTGRRHFRH